LPPPINNNTNFELPDLPTCKPGSFVFGLAVSGFAEDCRRLPIKCDGGGGSFVVEKRKIMKMFITMMWCVLFLTGCVEGQVKEVSKTTEDTVVVAQLPEITRTKDKLTVSKVCAKCQVQFGSPVVISDWEDEPSTLVLKGDDSRENKIDSVRKAMRYQTVNTLYYKQEQDETRVFLKNEKGSVFLKATLPLPRQRYPGVLRLFGDMLFNEENDCGWLTHNFYRIDSNKLIPFTPRGLAGMTVYEWKYSERDSCIYFFGGHKKNVRHIYRLVKVHLSDQSRGWHKVLVGNEQGRSKQPQAKLYSYSVESGVEIIGAKSQYYDKEGQVIQSSRPNLKGIPEFLGVGQHEIFLASSPNDMTIYDKGSEVFLINYPTDIVLSDSSHFDLLEMDFAGNSLSSLFLIGALKDAVKNEVEYMLFEFDLDAKTFKLVFKVPYQQFYNDHTRSEFDRSLSHLMSWRVVTSLQDDSIESLEYMASGGWRTKMLVKIRK
jgi:hypothetical protein